MRNGSTPRPERIAASALRLIFGKVCSSYTSGPGSCIRNGRKRNAKYGADRWCDACIAYDALTRMKARK